MPYKIKRDYIPYGQSRSGEKIDKVRFIVAHDVGNSGSTAQGNVNWFKGNPVNASAHTFIDDKDIIEDVPLWEKAWHVRYNVSADNRKYGDDANDCAIGVELCYGGSIDFDESYKRYVWYLAYLCEKFNLNPKTDIVGHSALDPSRKTDPENALHRYGKTFGKLIQDVYQEFKGDPMADGYLENGETGKAVVGLQAKLIKLGYDLGSYGADGSYGDITEATVRKFQKKNGLKVDGFAGKNTWAKLDELMEGGRKMEKNIFIVNSSVDVFAIDKAMMRNDGAMVFRYNAERNEVNAEDHIYVVGGGTKGLKLGKGKVVDLSGDTSEKTANKVYTHFNLI